MSWNVPACHFWIGLIAAAGDVFLGHRIMRSLLHDLHFHPVRAVETSVCMHVCMC
jgi:hypothetical protein